MELTPERLQNIAVDCVTKFLTKQASLSESIAKEAKDMELNPEQTKRVVEASNTLAYLRQLEKSADRTFEFELADYNKVLANMCLPSMQKSAASEECEEECKEKKEDKENKSSNKDKEKKENNDDKSSKEDEEAKHEKTAMLIKELNRAKSNLEKIACDKVEIHLSLCKAASVLHTDPVGLEKLAEVVAEEDFTQMLNLCGLEKRSAENLVFTDKELIPAREVYSLYKEASELIKTEDELKSFVKKANDFFFEKQSGLFGAAAGFVGRVAKSTISKSKKLATAAPEKLGKAIGGVIRTSISTAGSAVGKSLGDVAKTTGNAIGAGLKNVGSPVPKTGFTGASYANGFKKNVTMKSGIEHGSADIKKAVDHYDQIRATQGVEQAKKAFGGNSPSWLLHRNGFNKALTGATAVGVAAEMNSSKTITPNNVNELLPPKG